MLIQVKHNIFHLSNQQLTNNWWLFDIEIEFNETSHSMFADQTIYGQNNWNDES